MYIGPWQEYKLARLIQQRYESERTPQNQQQPGRQLRRPPLLRRPSSRDCDKDDAASVTSSTRSGLSFKSAQSAPSQLPTGTASSSSANSRFNNFYENCERDSRHSLAASGSQTRRSAMGPPKIPRPRSSSGSSAPAAKRKAKAKSGQPFQDERKARIQHMKRLYGLECGEKEVEFEAPSETMTQALSMTNVKSIDGYVQEPVSENAQPQHAVHVAPDSCTPDFDRALIQLQTSMAAREEAPSPAPERQADDDPLAKSLSGTSMGGSGGLIAWSKNLRPEDLSPEVTLSSFL